MDKNNQEKISRLGRAAEGIDNGEFLRRINSVEIYVGQQVDKHGPYFMENR